MSHQISNHELVLHTNRTWDEWFMYLSTIDAQSRSVGQVSNYLIEHCRLDWSWAQVIACTHRQHVITVQVEV